MVGCRRYSHRHSLEIGRIRDSFWTVLPCALSTTRDSDVISRGANCAGRVHVSLRRTLPSLRTVRSGRNRPRPLSGALLAQLVSTHYTLDDGTCIARLAPSPTQPEKGGLESFLAELSVPEIRRLLEIALPLPPRSSPLRLAWSLWHRARRHQARQCHCRRLSQLSVIPSLLQPP